MEMKKFCPKCGMEMEPEATFCPRCGECINGQPYQAPTPIQQYNAQVTAKSGLAAKIDFKKTIMSNLVAVICLGIGLTLFFVGVVWPTTSRYINSYAMTEYVGGDAYNFIIEACLRGGRIAGEMICKGILIAVGLLIGCISAMKINFVKPEQENN